MLKSLSRLEYVLEPSGSTCCDFCVSWPSGHTVPLSSQGYPRSSLLSSDSALLSFFSTQRFMWLQPPRGIRPCAWPFFPRPSPTPRHFSPSLSLHFREEKLLRTNPKKSSLPQKRNTKHSKNSNLIGGLYDEILAFWERME